MPNPTQRALLVNTNQSSTRVGDSYRVEKRNGQTYHVYGNGRAIRVAKRKTTMNDTGNSRQGMDYSVVRKNGAVYHSYRGYDRGAVRVGVDATRGLADAAKGSPVRGFGGPGLRAARKP